MPSEPVSVEQCPDLDDAAFVSAPHEHYKALRGAGATHVCTIGGQRIRAFFDHDGVSTVLRDRRLTAEEYPCAEVIGRPGSGAGYRGSAVYKALRRELASGTLLSLWKDRIATTARRLLESRRGHRELCLVTDFAQPLMTEATAGLLDTDAQAVVRWGNAFASVADAGTAHLTRARVAAEELEQHVASRLKNGSSDPCSVFGALTSLDSPESLFDTVCSLMVMLAAGHGTTSDMIANAVITLSNGGIELGTLSQSPIALGQAVDECLRLDPSVHQVFRTASLPVVIGDVSVARGETVLLALASAQRDEAVYADPDKCLLSRTAASHIAFGHGASYCIGAALAKAALRESLAALASVAPAGHVVHESIRWKPSAVLRGPMSVRFQPKN
jgi:cytochrome P450